jgi:hypothetical protein
MVPTMYKVRGVPTPTRLYRRFDGKHTYKVETGTVFFVSHDVRKLDLAQTAKTEIKKCANIALCSVRELPLSDIF